MRSVKTEQGRRSTQRRHWPSGRLAAAVASAKMAAIASRALGRGGGTSLPGLIALAVEPRTVARLAEQLPDGCIVIAGTNGKTTTSKFMAAILRANGVSLIHNSAGANLLRGVGSALIAAASPLGTVGQRGQGPTMGLFEVDEAALPSVVRAVRPRVMLAMNLFRDQLDRYGELDSIAAAWQKALEHLPPDGLLVANADDPLMAWLGRDLPVLDTSAIMPRTTPHVVYYGLDDPASGTADGLAANADTISCLACGHDLAFSTVYYGHLGHYSCRHCGFQRPTPSFIGTNVTLHGFAGSSFQLQQTRDGPETDSTRMRVSLRVPGLYNVYNAIAAGAVAHTLGLATETTAQAISNVDAAFGRAEAVQCDGRTIYLLLIKNPVGATEVLRLLRLCDDGQKGTLHLLALLNDNAADGHDISWIWDVDIELLGGRVGNVVFGGRRGADMALRFKYADVIGPQGYTVLPDIERALEAALAVLPSGQTAYVVATYTAMLEVRAILSRRGYVRPYWELATAP